MTMTAAVIVAAVAIGIPVATAATVKLFILALCKDKKDVLRIILGR